MIENILSNAVNALNFAVFLGILVFVHEWGHFITAKKLGVVVEQFALGFGPTIFSKTYNGTDYKLNCIPLGGYVKMQGDDRLACKGGSGEFFSKKIWQRSLIVFNGPLINFVLAYACLIAVFMFGYPDLSNKVGGLIDDYPAQQAGLLLDDQIIKINSSIIENWTDIQRNVAQSIGDTIEVVVVRDNQTMTKSIQPKVEQSVNVFGQSKEVRLIGVRPKEEIVPYKYDFITSVKKGNEKFFEVVQTTYQALYYMVTGAMSVKDSVQGPVGIYQIVTDMSQKGIAYYLLILGVISANLAIFNLLPIMPLDGGHLFLFAIEKVRGKTLPQSVEENFAKVGFSLLILLLLFTVYNDLVNADVFGKIKGLFLKQ